MKKWNMRVRGLLAAGIALGMLAMVLPGGIEQGFAQVNRVPALGINDSTGSAYANTEGQKNSYAWSFQNMTMPATATDFVLITGSATKTVKVARIIVDAQATGAANNNLYLLMRSTAASGGSAVAASGVPFDSAISAATGGVSRYLTLPTIGTLVGTIGAEMLNFESSTFTNTGGKLTWTWGNRPSLMPTLRGIAQALSINFAGQTVPSGATLNLVVETTEE